MPAERIAMRQVREVLRLKAAGVSGNEIARRVGVAPSTVRLTLKRLAVAGAVSSAVGSALMSWTAATASVLSII
jgi:DNA-binding NarL/FixJ family response regulator